MGYVPQGLHHGLYQPSSLHVSRSKSWINWALEYNGNKLPYEKKDKRMLKKNRWEKQRLVTL